MTRLKPVVAAALLALAFHVIATFASVKQNWPAQFGGVGPDAGDEWISRGTALGAPLLPLVVLAVAAAVASLHGRLGGVGVVMIC